MRKVLLVVFLLSSLNALTFEDTKKGCENNIGAACASVGAAYAFGIAGVVEVDIEKAKKYWKKGCDLENGSACATYASTITDINKRLEIAKKSCNLGNASGCKLVKEIQLDKLNKEKCMSGNSQACYEIAQKNLLKLDFTNAKQFFQLACKGGDKKSCSDYTSLEENGDITKLNAIKELKTKCDKSDEEGCVSVGVFYMATADALKDNLAIYTRLLSASIWFKKGCELGNKGACMYAKKLNGLFSKKGK